MNLVSTEQVLYFVVEIGTSPRMQRDNYLSCDKPDLGLLQTSGFSTGFANGHFKYISAVSSAFVELPESYNLNSYVMIPEIQC